MAITTLTPYSPPSDLMPIKEICLLLEETGHPCTEDMVRGWIRRAGHPTERTRGGKVLVSFSDILMSHKEALARRNQ